MNLTVPHRHLWAPERLTLYDLETLLNTAALIKQTRRSADGWRPLSGHHVALLCNHGSALVPHFQHAVTELGGAAALLSADEWRARAGNHIPEAARLLGRLYDAIDCCDLPTDVVEQIEANSGVPVFNGLTRSDHPMALLSELLTMRETMDKPLHRSRLDLAAHGPSEQVRPALCLARLAGIHVLTRNGTSGQPSSTATDEPDFILDTSVPPAANRLTRPKASAAQQGELNGKLADNRRCTLQAAIVCGLH